MRSLQIFDSLLVGVGVPDASVAILNRLPRTRLYIVSEWLAPGVQFEAILLAIRVGLRTLIYSDTTPT